MSTTKLLNLACGMCGHEKMFRVLSGTSAFGSPDLDLRPPELQRSTMHTWVMTCPVCGYAAGNLDTKPTFSRDFLETESYRTCDGLPFKSPLAGSFYRWHLCAAKTGNAHAAYFALLCAAWCCDDDGSDDLAVTLRRRSADFLESFLPDEPAGEQKEMHQLIHADLLRRTGQFERLLETYRPSQFSAYEMHPLVIAFERRLAREKDTRVHTVDELEKAIEGTLAVPQEEPQKRNTPATT